MNSEPVIHEISSDEEGCWNEEGDASHDWIWDLLGDADSEGEGSNDVVILDDGDSCASTMQKDCVAVDAIGGRLGSDSDDDCLVLDGDPDNPVSVVDEAGNGSDDLLVVGEKGQLACRDYPHPRHLCAKFPFSTTPHAKHCNLCHCYVCDSLAPCMYWGNGVSFADHCNSTDKEVVWRTQRQNSQTGSVFGQRADGEHTQLEYRCRGFYGMVRNYKVSLSMACVQFAQSPICPIRKEEDKLRRIRSKRSYSFEGLTMEMSSGTIEMKGKERAEEEENHVEQGRTAFIQANLRNLPQDNSLFLKRMRERFDRVGLNLPTVDVRFENLRVEADCEVIRGKPLPTLFNAFTGSIYGMVKSTLKVFGFKFTEARIPILRDVSGLIKPSRMTLLLGPPSCGKTTLLRALAGNLDHSLKVEGDISYNGFGLDEFVPQKTSVYVGQYDLHIPEMTVRETLDFSARCQGVGSRAELLMELEKREQERGILPDSGLDTYTKAISVEGSAASLQTDYVLKVLGLDTCSEVIIGDAMNRGISGGEKKRVTLGEMIVGPSRTFFMDEISNGLDSSTTFQIISVLQHSVHIMETTLLVSLLQPAPEIFHLFDEIILMAEGMIIYHGPRDCIFEFFENCGFKCPERKSPADFLHEVISRKDQAQYWFHPDRPYHHVSVEQFAESFKVHHLGQKLLEELSQPLSLLRSCKCALSFSKYSLCRKQLFRACISREWLLVKRNLFVYVFKSVQLIFLGFVTMTVFCRTHMRVDQVHANYYMGALFFSLLLIMINNNPELIMTISRLAVFYKHRDSYFYPAWAFSLPPSVLKIPHSFVSSLLFTSLSYYVIGYSSEIGRFICQFFLFFAVHLMSASLQRALGSVCRTFIAATVVGSFSTLAIISLGGFVLPLSSFPAWMSWGFWICPLSYAEIGITINEFRAPRWREISSANISIGEQVLKRRGLLFEGYFYWISLGALFGFFVLFNAVATFALTYLGSPSKSRPRISFEKICKMQGKNYYNQDDPQEIISNSVFLPVSDMEQEKGNMVLPFEPLALSFHGVHYFIDTPSRRGRKHIIKKNIQLLCDVTGAFRPRVLTALMGVSGAGKTTLLDVLSGRKTVGTIQGEIRVGGYLKDRETFCRVSGYCEQNDIHSPHITVEESVKHSAWLRLGSQIDRKTKMKFVNEVLETIELDEIKDNLVGIPGTTGLSLEQLRRLTLAVELVANPSIMFLDEPTSGLDARTAAIVMRAVKNVVDTGRTVVCTIHQPSTDIFESFDEMILMKKGGQIIYSGQIGWQSKNVISYFEGIPGVPKIKYNYNPAAWMLEVTSASVEKQLGIDFAQVYKESSLYQDTKLLVEQLSKPSLGSKKLHFASRFSVDSWVQFTVCLRKHCLSYWRSPEYNLKRILFVFISSLLFASLFWKHGSNINKEQDLFNIVGFMYCAITILGINNCQSIQGFLMKERLVLYRERFVGMYSSHVYSLAQIAIEIPYIIIQSLIFGIITYFSVGFHYSVYKLLWYLGTVFFTVLYFTYLGMLIISVSPSIQVATVYSSTFFIMSNVFTGFLIPRTQIPGWWVWCYWICPASWTLNALVTSQYGDISKEIEVFEEHKQVAVFLKDYFGFQQDQLPLVAAILISLPLLFASLFVISSSKLNFLKR
ncbi:hypothetical protein AAC387_Pa12g2411 [Persea americana]